MGIFSSIFENIAPAVPWLVAGGQGLQQEGYADDLRETARMLLNLPNQAGLDNSWEQISPILSQYTQPVTDRFNQFYQGETSFLDQVGGNIDEWLATNSALGDRLNELSARPLPDFDRPDIEQYMPQQITSLSEIPGFDLASQNLERAVGRSMASQGYGQSGNILNAVAQNLGELGLTAYNTEADRRNAFAQGRYATDVGRYNADISAYEAGVKGALAPLEILSSNITNTIGHLTGLRGRTAENIQSGINSFADFNEGISGNLMDYLAQAQSDRAGLIGSVADSVGQLYSDAGGLDASSLDAIGRLLGQGGTGQGGGISSILNGVGGMLDDLVDGEGTDIISGLGRLLGLGGAAGGAATTTAIPSVSGASIGEVFSGGDLLGQGASTAGSAGQGLMSGFNEWFGGPGGTLAGFALPAGLFARASMQSRGERNDANSLADSITGQLESAPAGSTVTVDIGGKRFNLIAGSRHDTRTGRWFRMADGRWVGISADGKNTPIITDTPPDVTSTASAPSYVQNNRTVTGPELTDWQRGIPGTIFGGGGGGDR